MRRAAEAWVIGAEGHLDAVQNAVRDLSSLLDESLGGTFDGHRNRSIVIRCADDEIGLVTMPFLSVL